MEWGGDAVATLPAGRDLPTLAGTISPTRMGEPPVLELLPPTGGGDPGSSGKRHSESGHRDHSKNRKRLAADGTGKEGDPHSKRRKAQAPLSGELARLRARGSSLL